ncbi:MAG: sulfotransferase [Bacteroidota bacterium]
MDLFSVKVGWYDAKCRLFKWYRTVKNRFSPPKLSKFLFILCPPYSGSTLLHEIICTSPVVSPNNVFGTREGQSLPEVRRLIEYTKRWEPEYPYPWEAIKAAWMPYWEHSKLLLLDKSPPNTFRAKAIQHHFDPSVFIVLTRNPYVLCESLMRKNKLSAGESAGIVVRFLTYQKMNLEQLSETLLIRYEDLVAHPDSIKENLLGFLPELSAISVHKKFKGHNKDKQKIPVTDLNIGKIEKIKDQEMEEINAVFSLYGALFSYFSYTLIHEADR